jgi:hypothetical protein
MPRHATIIAFTVLLASACAAEPPAFDPPPETYSESEVVVDGVSRTVASVDSTFFGRDRPMLGRLFVATDFGADRPVTIISDTFWMEHLGGRPEVIGTTIDVGGVARTIVGVMPRGVDVPEGVVLWIPRDAELEIR